MPAFFVGGYISKESPSLRLQPQLYKLADGFLSLDCTFPAAVEVNALYTTKDRS